MGAFDIFLNKEKLIRKTIEIDNSLYEKLRELSDKKYDASVNKMINVALMELIKTENINVYVKKEGDISLKHTLLIREGVVTGLDKLKDKYDISIYKLTNMAINNAINQIK